MSENQIVAATRTTATASRAVLVLVGTALGAAAFTVFLYWHAPYERTENVPYAVMLEVRDGWFVSHYWIGAVMGIGFVATGLALALLFRARAVVAGTVASALHVVGGVLVAADLAAEGMLYHAVTDQRGLDAEAGARMLDHVLTDGNQLLFIILGLVMVALGSFVAAGALIVTRVTPLWVPVLLVVGTLAMMAAPHAVSWWASAPRAVAVIAIAWAAWRSVRSTECRPSSMGDV